MAAQNKAAIFMFHEGPENLYIFCLIDNRCVVLEKDQSESSKGGLKLVFSASLGEKVENKGLVYFLKELRRKGVIVPNDQLLPSLFSALQEHKTKYKMNLLDYQTLFFVVLQKFPGFFDGKVNLPDNLKNKVGVWMD